jgi:hypothetical protein
MVEQGETIIRMIIQYDNYFISRVEGDKLTLARA